MGKLKFTLTQVISIGGTTILPRPSSEPDKKKESSKEKKKARTMPTSPALSPTSPQPLTSRHTNRHSFRGYLQEHETAMGMHMDEHDSLYEVNTRRCTGSWLNYDAEA